MNDHELDRLLKRANPYGDDTVRQLPTGDAVSDLLEDIISTEAPDTKPATTVPTMVHTAPRRRGKAVVLLAAAAAVAVALTGVFFPKGSNPIAPVSAYGAQIRAVTDASPRLLLDDPAWKITDVPVFTADDGEIKFARGEQELQVNWRPAGLYADYIRGTQDPGGLKSLGKVEVLGQTGTLHPSTPTDLTAILRPQGRYFLMIRGDVGSVAGYRNLLTKLKTVDTDTWLNAMPNSIVKQSDAPRVIDEMLDDVPQPTGFDRTPMLGILVLSRYQFGAKLTGSIACGWVEQWDAARKAGDTAKVKQITGVMQGSRNWKVLQEMNKIGRFSDGLWEAGDRMAQNRDPREGLLNCRR